MLRRLAIALAVVVASLLTSTPALAAPPNPVNGVDVHCAPNLPVCTVGVWHGGGAGGRLGSGGPGTTAVSKSSCREPGGAPVACYAPSMGWYSQSLHCYYLLMSPWPAPGDSRIAPIKPYHKAGDGGYYMRTCAGGAPTAPMRDYVWMPSKPPGYGWRLSPDVLAARAVRMLRLGGPRITLSPPLTERQIVGLPMWAWTPVTSSTWGRHSATASAGGESVTATAVSTQIYWAWGDGTGTTCTGPGTAWTSAYDGNAASPTCGHTYAHDSYGGEFPVTASTTWQITWVGAGLASGAHGSLTVVAPARARVHVSELQAVNVPTR